MRDIKKQKALPFRQTLFGKLPKECLQNIFDFALQKKPVLKIIENRQPTAEEEAEVIALKEYHVMRSAMNDISLGFAKRSKDGSIEYTMVEFDHREDSDDKSVFGEIIKYEPSRLDFMADLSSSPDTYAFYFLEEEIINHKGIVIDWQDTLAIRHICRDLHESMARIPGTSNENIYHINFNNLFNKKIQLNITLQRVLFGNQEKAEKLLRADPSLLLLKNTDEILDFSSKPVIYVTPLQAALRVGDDKMAEMIIKIFIDHDMKEHIQAQITEVFPKGIRSHIKEQKRTAFDFSGIATVILGASFEDIRHAMANQNDGSSLCKELDKFRADFQKISDSDKIFNPYHFYNACKIYKEHFNALTEENYDKRHYQRGAFARLVMGFAQRSFSAYFTQLFAQDIYNLTERRRESFQRTFTAHGDSQRHLRPILHAPRGANYGLGFTSDMVSYYRELRGAPRSLILREIIDHLGKGPAIAQHKTDARRLLAAFKTLLSEKNHRLEQILYPKEYKSPSLRM